MSFAPIHLRGDDHPSTYLRKDGHLFSLSTYLGEDGHLSIYPGQDGNLPIEFGGIYLLIYLPILEEMATHLTIKEEMSTSTHLVRRRWSLIYLSREGWPPNLSIYLSRGEDDHERR